MDNLKSKVANDRIRAAKALGELGPKANPAKHALCAAMVDTETKVREAAADALKSVDPDLQKLAVAIAVNSDFKAIETAGKLKEEGESLTPLILALAKRLSAKTILPTDNQAQALGVTIRALAGIAPDDTDVNKLIIATLTNTNDHVRGVAIDVVLDLKNKKQAVKSLILIAKTDNAPFRVKAIDKLVVLVEEDNEGAIAKAINAMRFDKSPEVRQAVEQAMEKLKPKK
jgi:hypothetical protein